MKRLYILITFMFLISLMGYSQKIIYDKTDEQGSRIILTSDEDIYTGWTHAAALSMAVVTYGKNNAELLFYIDLTLNEGIFQFAKGRKLLLKCQNGDIIELQNTKEIGAGDYKFNVTSSGTYYYTSPNYSVTEEQIQKIIDDNIVKIRIETDTGELDRDIKKNNFSKAVANDYQFLKERLKEQKSVYDGF